MLIFNSLGKAWKKLLGYFCIHIHPSQSNKGHSIGADWCKVVENQENGEKLHVSCFMGKNCYKMTDIDKLDQILKGSTKID